jgi:rubrerythrin
MKMMKTNFSKSVLVTILLVFGFTTLRATSDKTVKDLQAAFTGESTASAKYTAFAKKAREEGNLKVAVLFDAASKAESIHAKNHKAVLQQLNAGIPVVNPKFDVKTTADNLKDAIAGESYEVATMYPGFITDAQSENVNLAMVSFNYAFQVEKKHKVLYEKALKALQDGQEKSLPSVYMVCGTCGNTYENAAPERCGISMTPKDRFIKIGA